MDYKVDGNRMNKIGKSLRRQLHFNTHMGRMGNQMFQYACAKAMWIKYGFTTSISDLDKMPYFCLEPGERWKNRIKNFLFFRLWKPLYGMDILNTELNCMQRSYQEDLVTANRPTMVWGFFQSPEYFAGVEDAIREYFKVKPIFYTQYRKFLSNHQLEEGKYLAIHVRRTDYKGFTVPGLYGDDFTLPESYYHDAIEKANWRGSVVFVSDDPDTVNELFPEMDNKIISREDAISDFLIIRHSGACILSNSTFAWWAGWLNNKAQQVYCPKYFLGFKEQKEIPVKIYPANWTQLEVVQQKMA